MTVNRNAFRELTTRASTGGEPELDELIAYAAISMCEPGGLTPLLTAAYAHMDLTQAQDAIDHLILDGLVTLTSDYYLPVA